MKIYEQAFQQALIQCCLKLDALWYTENLKIFTELSFHEANVKFLGTLGCNKNFENEDFLDKETTENKVKISKRNSKMKVCYAYRLIGVISHIGKRLNLDYYIDDTYDFERQVWFIYNYLQVSNMEEAFMQRLGFPLNASSCMCTMTSLKSC